jgi:hypothetical protein
LSGLQKGKGAALERCAVIEARLGMLFLYTLTMVGDQFSEWIRGFESKKSHGGVFCLFVIRFKLVDSVSIWRCFWDVDGVGFTDWKIP